MDEEPVNDELTVPFAYCDICKHEVPVIRKEFDFDEETPIEALVCPHCYDILNMNTDVELLYYSIEDVEEMGYRVVKEEED